MTRVEFQAAEYHSDTTFHQADYALAGSVSRGWSIYRNGKPHLELGPGYQLLQTRACGVCSTDLARHFLPFPLPQITGHEVLATDQSGRRYAVEINASHHARGVKTDCPFCLSGLPTHCPERLVLGIHDLPGGFGPYLLAPVDATLEIPDSVPSSSAVLLEPLAAALHAVTSIQPRRGDRVAVLGPRRLGMLIVAALSAWSAKHGLDLEVIGLARRQSLLDIAREFGATETHLVVDNGAGLPDDLADVVIDSTGNPEALPLALRLAKREVHLKSTHGRPACGLSQLTALVVDEIGVELMPDADSAIWRPDADGRRPRVAWLTHNAPPAWLASRSELIIGPDALAAREAFAGSTGEGQLPRADFAVVSSAEQIDAAIRPSAQDEISLIRPRGAVLLHPDTEPGGSPLITAITQRGVCLSSSRCGDFRLALDLMAGDPELLRVGEKLVTHHFPSDSMETAFETARSTACIKAVIEHPAEPTGGQAPAVETSLGFPAKPVGSLWALDLTDLPLIHGLSVVSRALSEEIVAQAKSDRIDINVERSVSPRENPELLRDYGVTLIKVCAEHESVRSIADHPEACEHHLRALLGFLQQKSYRESLLPADRFSPSKALVADFSNASTEMPNRFVMEFVRSSVDSTFGFLRITIEDPCGRRLNLESMPHIVIDDIQSRRFIAGSTRIAQTWAGHLRREAERGRRSFTEIRNPYSHLFRSLEKAGLGIFERVSIHWGDASMPLLLEAEPTVIERLLKRVLLAVEDARVWEHLSSGSVLRVDVAENSVYLDVSHLGRVLNISIGRRRQRTEVGDYLARMPVLQRAVSEAAEANSAPLAAVSVFLVHHMTAEVLGLIAALRQLGCTDLTCLFVVYGGEPPSAYLEAVLDVPPSEFRSMALVNVAVEGRVEGHYRLSSQYGPAAERDVIEAALEHNGGDYLSAMRAAAAPAFLSMLDRAKRAGRSCAIVEDGGYLQPVLQDACLRGIDVGEMLRELGIDSEDGRPVAELLKPTLLGGVEHTRNGFDRLSRIEERHGRLAFPSFSIAISDLKTQAESQEVSASILNAVETVLNATGRVLSRRKCLVIGSRGAIGGRLMWQLSKRLDNAACQLLGIDLKVQQPNGREAMRFDLLPEEERFGADLVIGVAGISVLTGEQAAAWLLRNPGRELFLASGSTKTVEFEGLAAWLEGLLQQSEPHLEGEPVEIDSDEVLDARTGRVYGRRYSFRATNRRSAPSHLVFIANRTPANFLFYGVPTELIDEVLAQLATTTLGLVQRAPHEELPCRLLAVDRDIDAHGRSHASQ